ncbi:IQ motif and ubiquitin-like domain-containing protein isoform X2 [Vanacampus margaritifer]
MAEQEGDAIIPPESEENQGQPVGEENQTEALPESEDQGEQGNQDEALPGVSTTENQGEPGNEEETLGASTSEDQGEQGYEDETLPGVNTSEDQREPGNEEEQSNEALPNNDPGEAGNQDETAPSVNISEDQLEAGNQDETAPSVNISEDQLEAGNQVETAPGVNISEDQGEAGHQEDTISVENTSEDQRKAGTKEDQEAETVAVGQPSDGGPTDEQQAEDSSENELQSTATVKVMLMPAGHVMTATFATGLSVQQLRRHFADQLNVSAEGLNISLNGQEVEDEQSLSELGVEPHSDVIMEMTSSEPDIHPLLARARSEQEEDEPNVINVSLRTDESGSQDVPAESGLRKAFLGGYRHKVTGAEYHHAAAQTPRRCRPGKGVDVVSRDAQVGKPGHKSQDGRRRDGFMKDGSRTSDGGAGVSDAAVRVQRHHADDHRGLLHFQHGGQAAQPGMLRHCRRVSQHPAQRCDPPAGAHPALAELPGGGPAEAGSRPSPGLAGSSGAQEARGAGRAAAGLPQPLVATAEKGGPQPALQRPGKVEERQGASDQRDAARGREESRPVLAVGAGDAVHRHHRTSRHRHQEQQLQQSRQEVPGQGRPTCSDRTGSLEFALLTASCCQSSAPHQWRAADGRLIEMDTPDTIRARELGDLYDCVAMSPVSQEQRLDVLLCLKQTVEEHPCPLTREMVDLISREEDLMRRQVKTANLEGLRKRLCTYFLQFIRTPGFNPEVAKHLKVPPSPSQLRNDVFLCHGCQRYLSSAHFRSCARAHLSRRCLDCARLKNVAGSRDDFSCYKNMLKRLREAELLLNKDNVVPFILQVEDIQYLVEFIWGSRSALSGTSDLYSLVLVRWDRNKDWSPWNCVLLCKDETDAHLLVEDLLKVYDVPVIRSIEHKHLLARRHYNQIPGMAGNSAKAAAAKRGARKVW